MQVSKKCSKANKMSLNQDKTRFTLFHRLSFRDNLPFQLTIKHEIKI